MAVIRKYCRPTVKQNECVKTYRTQNSQVHEIGHRNFFLSQNTNSHQCTIYKILHKNESRSEKRFGENPFQYDKKNHLLLVCDELRHLYSISKLKRLTKPTFCV